MTGRITRWLTVAALTTILTACSDGTDARSGSVSILLTDAPGDVVEAWVTITDIYLQGRGGEHDPGDGRVYLLRDGAETHELLELANSFATLVDNQEVPAGTYGQLRVVIADGCIVTEAGGVYSSSANYELCGTPGGTLKMPSYAQTGAKVLLHGLTVTGGQHVVMLDFDVSQSFGRQAGASNSWVMNPVIHAAELGLTAGVSVSLNAGEVELPGEVTLGDFSATLTPAEGDVSELAFEEVDGVFRANFRFLIPSNGPFEVVLNAPPGLTVDVSPGSPQSVAPASGQTATIDWVLQSAVEDE